eukprot:Protomagalhaensia_wolfi_Nauph_80__1244@NODE_1733_length_1372_cov_214_750188_g1348_i0_p1_GENE_NODE_1733_length_1372_cov_214_750188_g1348_i0NODE_1733_length_1372_cov_214_750188_g1348_i0_p1_ORF_typecomplete_len375_score54_47EppA_BapA/PF07268_11/0_056HEAT_2/PF13646_6/0_14PAT1/PF09770_9/0_46_NODE_1733_length_1372_cov_214_750188_g1348_i0721127
MTENEVILGCLDRLARTIDTKEGLTIIEMLSKNVESLAKRYESKFVFGYVVGIRSEIQQWSLDFSQVLQVLFYLERICGLEPLESSNHHRLVRETASLIERWLLIDDFECQIPDLRPVCSPLMVQTEDPTILRALCRILWRYSKNLQSEEIQRIINTKVSTSLTVLDRLLQLLYHPQWLVRQVVIGILRIVESKEFPHVAENLAYGGRHLLAMPPSEQRVYTGYEYTVLDLFTWTVEKYPVFIRLSMESGLMEDILLVLEAYNEVPVLQNESPDVQRMPGHNILCFLWLVLDLCTDDQRRQLAHMGCFDVVRRCHNLEPTAVSEVLTLSPDAQCQGTKTVENKLTINRWIE